MGSNRICTRSVGGPDVARTRYLRGANAMLSQVSYGPMLTINLFMAEAEGLEPPRPLSPAAFKAVSSSSRVASMSIERPPGPIPQQTVIRNPCSGGLSNQAALVHVIGTHGWMVGAPGVEPGSLALQASAKRTASALPPEWCRRRESNPRVPWKKHLQCSRSP